MQFQSKSPAQSVCDIPPEIQDNLERWVWIANRFRELQVIIGLLGIIITALMVNRSEWAGRGYVRLWLHFALDYSVLLTWDQRSDSTRRAWWHLNSEVKCTNEDGKVIIFTLSLEFKKIRCCDFNCPKYH